VSAFVALLRAVNVSGTGLLPMKELRAMGEACGFERVRTFIASGNLLFDTDLEERAIAERLGARLEAFFGKRVPVMVRSAAEMRAVADNNPFPDEPGSRNMVYFLAEPVPADLLATVRGQQGERIAFSGREISVAYGEGIRNSRLIIPLAKAGTARNRNTVAKLAALLEEPE
jgi:uncharacterized protein (DUF1697 family)